MRTNVLTECALNGDVMGVGWRDDETKALIGLWGDVQEELYAVTRNRVVYERVAVRMNELGFDRTWQQCRTKVKNLTQQYRKVPG